ncbi:hypothetical protein D3C75_1075460 [compost metagenome]
MFGECGFTQHVVGVAEPFGLKFTGICKCESNGFAGHELLAHQPHRHVDALADHRLPTLANNTA